MRSFACEIENVPVEKTTHDQLVNDRIETEITQKKETQTMRSAPSAYEESAQTESMT